MAVDGDWNLTMTTPMGERNATLSVKSSGSTLTGTQGAEGNTAEIFDGTVNGNDLTWKVSITNPMPLTLEFTGKVSGDSMSGDMGIGPMGSFPFTGKGRKPAQRSGRPCHVPDATLLAPGDADGCESARPIPPASSSTLFRRAGPKSKMMDPDQSKASISISSATPEFWLKSFRHLDEVGASNWKRLNPAAGPQPTFPGFNALLRARRSPK